MIEWKTIDKWDNFGQSSFRATVAGWVDLRLVHDLRAGHWDVQINGRPLKGKPADLDGAKALAAKALAKWCRKALDEIEDKR